VECATRSSRRCEPSFIFIAAHQHGRAAQSLQSSRSSAKKGAARFAARPPNSTQIQHTHTRMHPPTHPRSALALLALFGKIRLLRCSTRCAVISMKSHLDSTAMHGTAARACLRSGSPWQRMGADDKVMSLVTAPCSDGRSLFPLPHCVSHLRCIFPGSESGP
jgi:hypothetical protein